MPGAEWKLLSIMQVVNAHFFSRGFLSLNFICQCNLFCSKRSSGRPISKACEHFAVEMEDESELLTLESLMISCKAANQVWT